MIRVLVGSSASSSLESAIRASPSLEFAGTIDPHNLSAAEFSGDVLLVDVADAVEQDWQALADLPIPVVVLLDPADSRPASSLLRAGIRGAIPADATPQEIEAAMHAVNAGLVVTTPASLADLEELAEPLSDREAEVLDLLAEGLSNKLIAHRLNISEHTVKTHVASIFGKLGASSRTEAVSQAIRRGLVML